MCWSPLSISIREKLMSELIEEALAKRPPSSRREWDGDRLRPISTSASSFFRVRPIRLRPILTSANFQMLNFWTIKCGAPKGGAPKGGEPKFSRFSFPPPAIIFFLLSLGPEMCTFGVLGLSCASPGGPVWWAAGGSHTTREPKRAQLRVPAKTPTKFNERTPREGRMNEISGGEKKKERNFGRSRGRAVRQRGGQDWRVVQRRVVRRRVVRRRVIRRRVVLFFPRKITLMSTFSATHQLTQLPPVWDSQTVTALPNHIVCFKSVTVGPRTSTQTKQ